MTGEAGFKKNLYYFKLFQLTRTPPKWWTWRLHVSFCLLFLGKLRLFKLFSSHKNSQTVNSSDLKFACAILYAIPWSTVLFSTFKFSNIHFS